MKNLLLLITLIIITNLYPQTTNNLNGRTSSQISMFYYAPTYNQFLFLELNSKQRDILSPPPSFVIFNTSSKNIEYYSGIMWRPITPHLTKLPTISTTIISDITATRATSGGTITSDGGSKIIDRGVCWSSHENPTIADSITSDSIGVSRFTSHLKGLMGNTKYFLRAYAINNKGIAYGNEVSFKTHPFKLLCIYDIDFVTLKIDEYNNNKDIEWQESLDTIHWTIIPNAINDAYQFIPTQPKYYRALIKTPVFEPQPSSIIFVHQMESLNFIPEYKAVYDAMVIKPSTILAKEQNAFVKREVDSGRWKKLDYLSIHEAHSNLNGEALINWIKPTDKGINNGISVFIPYTGFTPDGIDDFIDSGYNPCDVGSKFTKNSLSYGCYFRSPMVDHSMGGYTTGGSITLCANLGGSNISSAYVSSTQPTIYPIDQEFKSGFLIATRNSATTTQLYQNKKMIIEDNNSGLIPNLNMYTVGGINNNGILSNRNNSNISMAFFGSFLTKSEVEAFEDSYLILKDFNDKYKLTITTSIDRTSKTQLTIPTYVALNDEVVHPAIVNCGRAWNGYQYWMAITPFTNHDNQYENPSIYCSTDGITWITPDGVVNPVIPKPATGYNADVFLFFEDNKLFMGWTNQNLPQTIYLVESSDGFTWTNKTSLLSASAYSDDYCGISTLVKVGHIYYLYYVSELDTIRRLSSQNIYGPYENREIVTCPPPSGLRWNHVSFKYYNNKFYILATTQKLTEDTSPGDFVYLGYSNDGITFTRMTYPILYKTETWENMYYMTIMEQIGNKIKIFYSYITLNGWFIASADLYLHD